MIKFICPAAYCFLDLSNRISVSNWGPALMGLSDGIKQILFAIAMLVVFLNTGQEVTVRGYQIAAIVLLVIATWLVLFCCSRLLPRVYTYHTLRFRTQVNAVPPPPASFDLQSSLRTGWLPLSSITAGLSGTALFGFLSHAPGLVYRSVACLPDTHAALCCFSAARCSL